MKKLFIILFSLYSVNALSDDFDCSQAMTTPQINYCAGVELEKAEAEMNTYLTKSKEHNGHDMELIKSIEVAQKAWTNYANAHCDAIYTQWRGGTIRGLMSLSCKTKVTKQRTHEIWANFLTYMDSTPAVLPEPEL
ncbi:lysozyme inhibitor LprI family protein [Psychromonas algicola]|uniref:lysozyme inhibitor LprI family protein n=1 Tax=Psychromonas algicola TaxID=2555642 RepID=UPI0010688C53|nr:lysozyme inhibitor LprI family protein [Psychromonas sp. RZ5]TEW42685.1 DUF1311 domain-containing protein [Psychromonas sp. RZ5]